MITACSTGSPRYSCAVSRIRCRIIAESSCGEQGLPSISTHASPFSAATILNGAILAKASTSSASSLRPIRRLTAKTVRSGLVMAWRLAIWPTSFSPLSV